MPGWRRWGSSRSKVITSGAFWRSLWTPPTWERIASKCRMAVGKVRHWGGSMVRSLPFPDMHETTMTDELDNDEARALRATRIIDAVAAIPRGRGASYGAIAARAGYPGRAPLIG